MSETYGLHHGFRTLAADSWTDYPCKVPLGSLLMQTPLKRAWTFEGGATGRHNPELRHRLLVALGLADD